MSVYLNTKEYNLPAVCKSKLFIYNICRNTQSIFFKPNIENLFDLKLCF